MNLQQFKEMTPHELMVHIAEMGGPEIFVAELSPEERMQLLGLGPESLTFPEGRVETKIKHAFEQLPQFNDEEILREQVRVWREELEQIKLIVKYKYDEMIPISKAVLLWLCRMTEDYIKVQERT